MGELEAISISARLYDKLRERAERHGRGVSDMATEWIEELLSLPEHDCELARRIAKLLHHRGEDEAVDRLIDVVEVSTERAEARLP